MLRRAMIFPEQRICGEAELDSGPIALIKDICIARISSEKRSFLRGHANRKTLRAKVA